MEKEKFKLAPILLIEKLPMVKIPKPHWKEGYEYIYRAKYLCFCGKLFLATTKDVKSGRTKSCGCYQHYLRSGGGGYKDGRAKTRLYRIYLGILKRLTDKNNISYRNYGGRGITICKEWLDYTVFKEWAFSNGYSDNLSIDRKDVNGNYTPENCRWGTVQDQACNRRKKGDKKYTSKYKGVSIAKNSKLKWFAQITINRQSIFLGKFKTEREAAIAYNKAALKYHKEFANLNTIDSEYPDKT